eukprot:m.50975 g.50975  ORF g.50975 m.50975 type:complete len:412 (+) comp10698_c0_seq4:84-1319(+)
MKFLLALLCLFSVTQYSSASPKNDLEPMAYLESLSDWIVSLNVGSNVLKNVTYLQPRLLDSVFINGNLARVLLATHRLQQQGFSSTNPNATYLKEGLRWCTTLCTQQQMITSSKGNKAGFWGAGYPVPGPAGNIYFGDTGTAVTALGLCYHLTSNATEKTLFRETMDRYATFVREGSNVAPVGKKGTCNGFIEKSGSVGCGYYGGVPSVKPYVIATATTGAAFFAELNAVHGTDSSCQSLVTRAIDYIASVVLSSGEIPYILNGINSSTSHPDKSVGVWPFDTISYCTEGIVGSSVHNIVNDTQLYPQFESTLEYLVKTQNSAGYWGSLGSSDLMRSPRVVTLLSWGASSEATPSSKKTLFKEASSKYIQYLLQDSIGKNYGVMENSITTGMAGIAVADSISLGVTYGINV